MFMAWWGGILTNVVIFAIKYLMKALKVLGATIATILMLIFGAAVLINAFDPSGFIGADSKTPEQPQAPITYVDPQLQPLVSKLGIDPTGLTIKFTDSVPNKGTADFDGTSTISILRSGSKSQTPEIVLAHEYLHYKWSRYTQAERDSLSVQFESLYSSDSQMHARMQPYIDNDHLVVGSQEFSNELHSVYCTESSDKYLSQPVLAECNRWINRSAITFLR